MTYGEHTAGDFEIVRNALAEMTHYEDLDYDDDGVPEQLRVLSRTAIRLVGDFDAEIKRVAARMIEGYDPVAGEPQRYLSRQDFLALMEMSRCQPPAQRGVSATKPSTSA